MDAQDQRQSFIHDSHPAQMNSVVDYLEHWAEAQPDKLLNSFLDLNGAERESYTYREFNERTNCLADFISRTARLRPGDRVLLVYPPGLEVTCAFFACVRAGVIPVPVGPPSPMNFAAGIARLGLIAADCKASIALTTRRFHQSYRLQAAQLPKVLFRKSANPLPSLKWLTTDDIKGHAPHAVRHGDHDVLFLQYTSGSTGDPKGVVVTHANIIHNGHATLDHVPSGVSWLPQYHDMGLIGYQLYPILAGGTSHCFSPLDFLRRPLLWFQTISRVRATCASAPNFAFEYCLREDKLPAEALQGIDLRSVRIMMSASEPVRPDTFVRFQQRFARYGLQPGVHVAAYGLAENTLAATHFGRRVMTVDERLIQRRTAQAPAPASANLIRLVSCGAPLRGIDVRIVDAASRRAVGEGTVGEIWIAGESTCRGYWNRPELNRHVFGNRIANDPSASGQYMRTGDLGFLQGGELFVCGRLKDVIIIRGINHFPQDIETVAEAASPRIKRGGVAAFALRDSEDSFAIIVEIKPGGDLPDPAEIARAVRTRYNIEPHTIVLARPGAISRTTSGKIARKATRERWQNGELSAVATHTRDHDLCANPAPSELCGRFRYLVEPYDLKGDEDVTFAEVGIDSIALAQLMADLQELLEECGAGDLALQIDTRLLQRLTVAEFFAALAHLEKNPEKRSADLRRLLKRVGRDVERYEHDCMRADATLEQLGSETVVLRDEPVRDVLLTGATGFFGPFLLNSLLEQTPYTYYTLLRGTDPMHALERLKNALRRAGLWTPELAAKLQRRVRVVCGDLSRHNLGILPGQWTSLSSRIGAIVHNAAVVNYVLNYDAMRPHNVDATRELLRFSFAGIHKEFHLVSSTFVFGWTPSAALDETDNNDEMRNLDFGYAQSKWVAEQLVLASRGQGLTASVYRPSLISASTGGVGSRDDIAIRLLAFMIKQGIAVDARNQVSFVPADVAADNIAAIFNGRHGIGGTFHVTSDTYYNMGDITRLITAEFGYPFAYFDVPRFVTEINRRCGPDDPLYPLVDFFNRSHRKIAAMQHKRYRSDRYREAREKSGAGRRDPPLRETVSSIITFMRREGLIAETCQGATHRAAGSLHTALHR